jgi:putative addiction module component (TIGR02574 family)
VIRPEDKPLTILLQVTKSDQMFCKNGGVNMTANAEQLLADALQLPPGERAQLAERLFSSLDISQDELDRLWAKEADSRIDAYEDGRIKTISSSRVFKNIYS